MKNSRRHGGKGGRAKSCNHAFRPIDPTRDTAKNKVMSIDITSAQRLKALEESLSREPDREAMRRACEEMDRMREETRQRVGIVDVAVELVRDARDQ